MIDKIAAQRKADEITLRVAPYLDQINAEIGNTIRGNCSKINKIYKLWEIADRITSFYGDNVPCKKSCSYCCHIAVGMLPEEAAAIGKRIGVTPAQPEHLVDSFNDFPFGTAHPCTFLKDNLCSIYEHRPTVCRMHHVVSDDTWGCEFGESGNESRNVPLLNNQMPMQMALLHIVQPKVRQCLGDIRQFFPHGKEKMR